MVGSAQKYWSLIFCHVMKQSSGQKGMVASFKTVYNLEKDYCGMISAGGDHLWPAKQVIMLQSDGGQGKPREPVGGWRLSRPSPLPGRSLPSGKPSHLPDASGPPVTHAHLKRSPGHSAVLCYRLWLQPQWKLENRNHPAWLFTVFLARCFVEWVTKQPG